MLESERCAARRGGQALKVALYKGHTATCCWCTEYTPLMWVRLYGCGLRFTPSEYYSIIRFVVSLEHQSSVEVLIWEYKEGELRCLVAYITNHSTINWHFYYQKFHNNQYFDSYNDNLTNFVIIEFMSLLISWFYKHNLSKTVYKHFYYDSLFV